MSRDTLIIVAIDDGVSVRESLEALIRCEGWQPETFASAAEFLAHPRALTPSCLEVSFSGLNGLELQERIATDRRHPDDRAGHEGLGHRIPDQALQRRGLLEAIHNALERSRAALGREAEM